MTSAGDHTKHILWQNEAKDITIIDIPLSIEDAQNEGNLAWPYRLESTAHLAEPYSLPEPKSSAARAKLLQQHLEQAEHQAYVRLYQTAMKEVESLTAIRWCLDRHIASQASEDATSLTSRKNRKRQHSDDTIAAFPAIDPATVSYKGVSATSESDRLVSCTALDLTEWPVVANLSAEHIWLELDKHSYMIPPSSSFLCSDITSQDRGSLLRQAFKHQHGNSARFDLVVLDPPWHNASVKRVKHYSTLKPRSTVDLLLATDLDMLLADQCLVCMWITNKPYAREAVLGAKGIFAHWGVQLIEEWIWFKVTDKGALIFPLESITRKPYEVLLVGRKHRSYPVPPAATVVCRALFAVPDVHSRKPCLKSLLEPLLTKQEDYLALEVFARHLVAGWMSWGDECILFNDRSHWHSREAEEAM